MHACVQYAWTSLLAKRGWMPRQSLRTAHSTHHIRVVYPPVVYPYLVRYDVHSKPTRELESGVPSSYISTPTLAGVVSSTILVWILRVCKGRILSFDRLGHGMSNLQEWWIHNGALLFKLRPPCVSRVGRVGTTKSHTLLPSLSLSLSPHALLRSYLLILL